MGIYGGSGSNFNRVVHGSFYLKISENIHKANNNIEFIDTTDEKKSIKALEKFFLKGNNTFKDKNYIVLSSDYTTTLLSTGIEIAHRKIRCKVMRDGKFEFKYNFIPSDKEIGFDRYISPPNGDRFKDYSYKELLTTSCTIRAHEIKSDFKTWTDEENQDWNQITFSKFKTESGEIIDIEFSMSNKFDLTDIKDIEEHYESTYSYPHAVRNIKFQLENYKDYKESIKPIIPHLVIGDQNAKELYAENIYYKSYFWRIHYAENQNKDVLFKVV